eukprot:scaffold75375_cov65-Phaeocystis_antarctica.AAC.1
MANASSSAHPVSGITVRQVASHPTPLPQPRVSRDDSPVNRTLPRAQVLKMALPVGPRCAAILRMKARSSSASLGSGENHGPGLNTSTSPGRKMRARCSASSAKLLVTTTDLLPAHEEGGRHAVAAAARTASKPPVSSFHCATTLGKLWIFGVPSLK